MTGSGGSKPVRGRGLIICLCAMFVLLAGSGCAGRRPDDVLVILKTKSYHTESCQFVHMARTSVMTIAEAQELHCLPCPRCKPGRVE